MIELAKYTLEVLRKDEEFVLSRGQREEISSRVLVLSPAAECPAPEILKWLEHAYSLKEALDRKWAARPIAIVRNGDRMALVLEDPGGMPLDQLLEEPLEFELWLRLAIGLSTAINQLHQRGIINKDIKPANVLVDSVTGQCWLNGFLIASRLPRERQLPQSPEFIAGTLAYLAPEQTGRMNRSVDSRSDLYALGITLYEMLTGKLPFTAADPMEWVHCHIARQAIPPDERRKDVPPVVSAIILRLLSKTPEQRYQTAAGLEADLRKCLAEWQSQGRVSWFSLGAHDISDRFLIPEKLYGREREIKVLLDAFDEVVTAGRPNLLLVSGYSGIGKSSVVNELHKALVLPRGLFALGKFDQYKRDIPYATLAQAFQGLVSPLLSKSEVELRTWREGLRTALGPNGQLMVDLIPELKLIIGEQPAVPHLPPKEAQRRFQLVFRRFIGVFARPEHPLGLFLDDLQWLDAATLDFLEHLLTEPGVHHLMLVGAYRNNEVGATHPLWRRLEAIRLTGAIVHEIVLAPLSCEDLAGMIVDCLHCERERAIPLAHLVHDKTAGNPFFTVQFISALVEEGLLTFDRGAERWSWDLDRIQAKRYTDNVVDLMVQKLSRLPVETREALQGLACLGNIAETAILSAVLGTSDAALHLDLWEAVRTGLVFREVNAYEFLHDRIQQAAYSLIPEERRAEVHLRISRVLLAGMTADQLEENLFDVANQFDRSATQFLEPQEKAQVATVYLRSGRKAKAAAAFVSACRYFETGMGLLDESAWISRYDLMFNLRLEGAECELLTGNLRKAEQLIEELLQRAVSKVDQTAAYHLKVLLHTLKSENAHAVETALTSLGLLGIEIPAHPNEEQVHAEYEAIWRSLDGRPIESLIELPLMNDRALQSAMQVLSTALGAVYFTDMQLFNLLACRMANLTWQHGVCGASAHGFAYLGGILGPVFHRYAAGNGFAKLACDLVDKHGFIAYQAKVYHAMAIVAVWTQPLATVIDFNQAGFRAATETGDLTSACYSMSRSVTILLLRGDSLDAVWQDSERSLEFALKAGYRDTADRILSQQRFIAAMQGRTASLSSLSDSQFDESTFEAQLTNRTALMVYFYWIIKLQSGFLAGEYREALVAAGKAKELLWSGVAHIQMLDYFYYTALTVTSLYENAGPSVQAEWRNLLAAHREQLREWADNYPPTFADKHALVSAEIARVEGRDLEAMRLYDEAIRAAHENGFVQNEGIACEVATRFYAARGFDLIAETYLRKARYCYLRWGGAGKVRQLDELYPQFREIEPAPSPTTTIGAPIERLDLATVIKLSQAISGEIVFEKVIQRLMHTAVEHAGAERCVLILDQGDEQRIEAEACSDRDKVTVQFRRSLVTPSELPESLLRYVVRTQKSVTLRDASAENLFSQDEYIRRKCPRSVFGLPLINQGKLVGVLYLENNLASGVFTSNQLAILELIASEAAIALDQARLYEELSEENSERRKAENALRASEERWRKLFENSSAGIVLIAPDGRYVAANSAFQKTVGYTEAELRRLNTVEVTLEEDRSAWKAILAEAMEGGRRAYRLETRYRRKDGRPIWTDVSIVFVPAGETARAFYAVVIVDISERKRAEEELRRSEAFLALGQRISHTGSWGWQVAAGSIDWSQEHFRIFEYDPETERPSYSLFIERIHPEDRGRIEEAINRAVREKTDFEFDYRIVLPDESIKFLRSVGQAVVNPSGELEFIGTTIDITSLKRAEEMQIAIAREREMLMRQRAADLAKANEALRSCLDALASVPELDAFIGQVMATITQQLGAVASTLRVRNFEQNTLPLQLVFQDGRVMTPDEAKYPECWQSVSVEQFDPDFLHHSACTRTNDQQRLVTSSNALATIIRILDPHSPMPDDQRSYLRELGVKTVLIIPLTSRGQVNGRLTFRFTEERDFQAEELEIAHALATQASLAIHLTELAKSAKQSAVLEERNRLAGEIHDSLAQYFTGITMQLAMIKETMTEKDDDAFNYVERAYDLARFGLAEARRSVMSLQSMTIMGSSLIESLQVLADRSNIAGRLRCTFRSNLEDDESLPVVVQQDLLRIAQEAISNALRYAKSTIISVNLRSDPPDLVLKVEDNGCGITTKAETREGFGFVNMRARVKKLNGTLDIRTAPDRGTTIIVRVPLNG